MKTKIFLTALLAGCIGLLFAFRETTHLVPPQAKKGMIKVTILYPNGEGKRFDMDYYVQKHMPMVAQLLGDSLKLIGIDKGIASGTPNTPMPYLAIGYLYFDQLSAFQNSFKPVAEKIRNDIPNYTNVKAVIQISEVMQ